MGLAYMKSAGYEVVKRRAKRRARSIWGWIYLLFGLALVSVHLLMLQR